MADEELLGFATRDRGIIEQVEAPRSVPATNGSWRYKNAAHLELKMC